jgi:hypothetical protein
MADTLTELREIPYLRLFPWVRLFQGVRVALDGKKMILAAIGLGISLAGWGLLDVLFPDSNSITLRFMPEPLPSPFANRGGLMGALAEAAPKVADPPLILIQPFRAMFSVAPAPGEFWHGALAALWGAVVWGIIGGAIARIAVVQVAKGERIGLSEAVRFSVQKAIPLVCAPLAPLIGVGFFAAFCALMGLGYRVNNQAVLSVLGIFAFLPLFAGLMMAILLLGLAASWPLMHATVVAESEDTFDALSRSYAYVYQRPMRYAAYAVLAWALGTVGLLVVGVFARSVESLAIWGLSFGAPDDLLIRLFLTGRANDTSTAAMIHTAWITLVHMLAYGWVFSYFWTTAVIIYLLLRHDVDGTDWSDIDLPSPSADTTTQQSAAPSDHAAEPPASPTGERTEAAAAAP